MNKIDIYLDIDGVLLANEKNPANYAPEFIERVVNNYNTYWLTTHCRGDASRPVKLLSSLFPAKTNQLLKKIRPTNWLDAKTEAIDFTRPFLVFEDDLYPDEKIVLDQHNAIDNWILIDLAKDPNQLKDFLESFPIPVIDGEPWK